MGKRLKAEGVEKRKWTTVILSVVFGLFMGFLAYHFVPDQDYDIVRQWKVVSKFSNVDNFDEFVKVSKSVDREIIPQVYSLAIAKIGDYNLMQFFVVVVGYAVLCYILLDYKHKAKLDNGKFIMIFVLAVLGQSMFYYFTGLYNYVAINIFALAVYLDYIKGFKKIAWLLYIISPFIHSSLLLPLGLLIILKLKRGRMTMGFYLAYAVCLLFFSVILTFVIDLVHIDILIDAKNMYDSYVLHNSGMVRFYDGVYLFMTITKFWVVLLACWIERKNEAMTPLKNYTILLSLTVLILSFSSIALTRFSSLALFVSLPLIMSAMTRNDKDSLLLRLSIMIGAILFTMHTAMVMIPLIKI